MRNGPKPKREPSEREIHTLRLASHGKTAAEIATELELSVKTVRHHVEKVTRKLDAKNVTEAVAEAIRQGIIA
jgi:DNA-binding NarL/FixJ family response regulator